MDIAAAGFPMNERHISSGATRSCIIHYKPLQKPKRRAIQTRKGIS